MQDSFKYPRIKKIYYILEKIPRLDQKLKTFVSCNHMNCCLQKYTTHQFTYFILLYYSCQEMFKNSRIIKTHQVQQKLLAKPFLLFCLTCFLFVVHLNLK